MTTTQCCLNMGGEEKHTFEAHFCYVQMMSGLIPSQDPAAVSHSGGSLQGVQRPQGGSGWADGQVRRRGDLCGWHAFDKKDCVVPRSQRCRSSTSGKEAQGGHPENQASCTFWRSGGGETVRLNCVESCSHFKPTMLFFPVLITDQLFETFFLCFEGFFFWMKKVNKTVTVESVHVFEPTSIIPVFYIYIYLPTADHRILLIIIQETECPSKFDHGTNITTMAVVPWYKYHSISDNTIVCIPWYFLIVPCYTV